MSEIRAGEQSDRHRPASINKQFAPSAGTLRGGAGQRVLTWFWSHQVVGMLVFCAVVFLLGYGAVHLAWSESEVATWWPAAGISVGVVTVFHRSRWTLAVAIAMSSGLANLAGGRPIAIAVGFGIANTAEALVAAWGLRRLATGRPSLHGLADVWRLCLAALLGGLTAGAGAAVTVALFADGGVAEPSRERCRRTSSRCC